MPTCRRSTAGRGRSDSHSKIADFFLYNGAKMATMSQTWIKVEDKQQYGWHEVSPHVHLKSNDNIGMWYQNGNVTTSLWARKADRM